MLMTSIIVTNSLMYKFKKIIRNPNFSDLFKYIFNRVKNTGYTLDIMRQTACTAVVQASDSMTASM